MKKRVDIAAYILEFDEEADKRTLTITNSTKNVSVRFDSSFPTYTVFESFVEDGLTDYLHAYLSMLYIMLSTAPDVEFLTDFEKAYLSYVERVAANAPADYTDEKDALDDVSVVEKTRLDAKSSRE